MDVYDTLLVYIKHLLTNHMYLIMNMLNVKHEAQQNTSLCDYNTHIKYVANISSRDSSTQSTFKVLSNCCIFTDTLPCLVTNNTDKYQTVTQVKS